MFWCASGFLPFVSDFPTHDFKGRLWANLWLTPKKIDISINNGHISKGSPFQSPSFWLSFSGTSSFALAKTVSHWYPPGNYLCKISHGRLGRWFVPFSPTSIYKLALLSLGQTCFELRKEVQKKGAKSLGCKLQISTDMEDERFKAYHGGGTVMVLQIAPTLYTR